MTTGVGGNQMSETDEVSACTDLFQPRVREVGMVSGQTLILKNTQTSADSLATFSIKPTGNQYVQMNRSRLWITFRVQRANGDDLEDADDVSIVNLIGSSLFSSIKFKWNDTELSEIGNEYVPYKAFFETLLSYGQSAAASHLQASRFTMDTPEHQDVVANPAFAAAVGQADLPAAGPNRGYNIRGAWCRGSRPVAVECAVPSDFMQSDRLLPPGSNLHMTLSRSQDSFCLLSAMPNQQFKIHVDSVKLIIHMITLTPQLVEHHRRLNQKKPVLHNYKRTLIRTKPIPQGVRDIDLMHIFDGDLPRSIIFGLANADSVSGVIGKNPFYFPHSRIDRLALYVNNVQYPAEAYEPDFPNGLFIREYAALFKNTGIHHSDSGTTLSMEQWVDGTTLFAWDLNPDQCNGYHTHFGLFGDMNIQIRFGVATAERLTAIVVGIFDVVLKNSLTEQGPTIIFPQKYGSGV